MTSDSPSTKPAVHKDELRTTRLLTIPNVICVLRLIGSLVMLGLAAANLPQTFLWLFVILALSDWVDGKLAILLNQRSVFGARLDSWADAALYTALFWGGLWLHWDIMQHELMWAVPAIATYAVSTLFGFRKFGRWPSYHTRMAKISWFLITVGAVCVLAQITTWPLRVALASGILTNLEATAITWKLTEWRADVLSLYGVMQQQRNSS